MAKTELSIQRGVLILQYCEFYKNTALVRSTNFYQGILKKIQSCLNHLLNLKDSSPRSLYSLLCDVPFIAAVIARVALYCIHSILVQKLSLLGWSQMISQQSRCGLMKNLQIVKRELLGRVFESFFLISILLFAF